MNPNSPTGGAVSSTSSSGGLSWRDVWDETKGRPGDIATVLLVGVPVFVADAVFNPIGSLTAVQTSTAAAGGALGVKRGFEAWRLRRSQRKDQGERAKRELDRAKGLIRHLEACKDAERKRMLESLKEQVALTEAGITTAAQLEEATNRVVDRLQA